MFHTQYNNKANASVSSESIQSIALLLVVLVLENDISIRHYIDC